jgi:16S rRNA (guanine(966)-N(2))-methyltransferase RsmD
MTRPTSDRVREALFSIVGDVTDSRVLDLFAGTGALGIEALSRGAGHATFVERDAKALSVLRANLETVFGGAPPVDRVSVVRGDVLRRIAADDGPYDLILLDPPYRDSERLTPPLARDLPPTLTEAGVIVAECDRRAPLLLESAAQDPSQVTLMLTGEYKYGDTLLRVFRRSQAG